MVNRLLAGFRMGRELGVCGCGPDAGRCGGAPDGCEGRAARLRGERGGRL